MNCAKVSQHEGGCSHLLKAILNRCVFNDCLNSSTLLEPGIVEGRVATGGSSHTECHVTTRLEMSILTSIVM